MQSYSFPFFLFYSFFQFVFLFTSPSSVSFLLLLLVFFFSYIREIDCSDFRSKQRLSSCVCATESSHAIYFFPSIVEVVGPIQMERIQERKWSPKVGGLMLFEVWTIHEAGCIFVRRGITWQWLFKKIICILLDKIDSLSIEFHIILSIDSWCIKDNRNFKSSDERWNIYQISSLFYGRDI